jgi:hypothetical protein
MKVKGNEGHDDKRTTFESLDFILKALRTLTQTFEQNGSKNTSTVE